MSTEDVRGVIREYFDRLLNQRDLSVCDELLASGYVDHDGADGRPPGPEETKESVIQLLETYPDMQVEVKEVVVEGDRAAVRLRWRGTHAGTGKVVERQGITMLRLDERGQIAERWSAYN
ncbi:MAG: ester cyclase [Gemmatimonadota bacterium]